MDYHFLRFRIEDCIARIVLARPPLNVITIAMMRELAACLKVCQERRDVVALVFEAAPEARAFSAGVAVEDHAEDVVYQMLESFHNLFRTIEQMGKPLIALVDGAALGGGCEIVAACDIVIATERAKFGQPEIKLGVFPPVACVLLPRCIGEKRAREMILTGDLIDAQEAWRLGLVNYVVPAGQLEAKAQDIFGKFRELSASALQVAKQALELGRGSTFIEALDKVQGFYLEELMKTEDAHEGVRSFMQKRRPVWRNK